MTTSSSLATMRWTSSSGGVAVVDVVFISVPNHRPRVPDALQRSSRCCAEPGPYQTPAFVTAPALQRPTPRRGGALRCIRGTRRRLLQRLQFVVLRLGPAGPRRGVVVQGDRRLAKGFAVGLDHGLA